MRRGIEGQVYVPALLEALHLWRELQVESGRQVLLPIRALSIGPDGHTDLASTMRAINSYGLPQRTLDAAEFRERYPSSPYATTTSESWTSSAGCASRSR